MPGRTLELGCGSGRYRQALAQRCDELLQIDLVDRRAPAARFFPFVAMDAMDVEALGAGRERRRADILEHMPDRTGSSPPWRLSPLAPDRLGAGRGRLAGRDNRPDAFPPHRQDAAARVLAAVARGRARSPSVPVLETRPQYNSLWAFNAPMALARNNPLSWLAAKSISAQCRRTGHRPLREPVRRRLAVRGGARRLTRRSPASRGRRSSSFATCSAAGRLSTLGRRRSRSIRTSRARGRADPRPIAVGGPFADRGFERRFAGSNGSRHAVTFVSGRVALQRHYRRSASGAATRSSFPAIPASSSRTRSKRAGIGQVCGHRARHLRPRCRGARRRDHTTEKAVIVQRLYGLASRDLG